MVDKTEPMDAAAPERAEGEPATNNLRSCYAAKQLVNEVLDLFPETEWNFTEYNGRNVGLGVAFDTVYSQEFTDLLLLIDGDPRIMDVQGDDSGCVLVRFHNQPRTYDLRDPFGLDDAWLVLTETEEAEDANLDGAAPDYGDDSEPIEGGSAAKTSKGVQDGGGA